MAIADVKDKQSLKRDVLVRLEHARDITDTLVLDSGLVYDVAYSFEPVRVEENGVSRIFTWDEVELSVNLIAAPSDANPVVVYTRIYLTNSEVKYLDEDDPTGAITNVREWIPFINSFPTASQNVGDLIEGQLSISSTNLTCINDNLFFNDYLEPDDSFFNRPVSIWFGLDNNYDKVYEGKISGPTLSIDSIAFSFKDGLKKLLDDAFMGDDISEVVLSKENFPNMPENYDGSISPYITGMASYEIHDYVSPISGDFERRYPDVEKINRASIISITSFDASNDLVKLDLGRTRFQPVLTDRTLTVNAATTISYKNHTFDRVFVDDIKALASGMQINHFTVGQPGISISFIENISYDASYIDMDFSGIAFDTTRPAVRKAPFGMIERDESVFAGQLPGGEQVVGTGRSFSSVLTSGGNYQNTFETIVSKNADLNRVNWYYVWGEDPFGSNLVQKHGDVISDICEKAGLDVNSSSISVANSALNYNCRMQIPNRGETSVGRYLDYIQQITRNTFGVISFNSDGEVVYKLIDSIRTPSITINDTDISNNSLAMSIEFQDINTDYTIIKTGPVDYSFDDGSRVGESKRSIATHATKKTIEVQYLLDGSMDDYIDRSFEFSRQPRITYKFRTSMKFYDINISDTIRVVSSKVKGGSVDLLVTGFSKSVQEIAITAIEVPL